MKVYKIWKNRTKKQCFVNCCISVFYGAIRFQSFSYTFMSNVPNGVTQGAGLLVCNNPAPCVFSVFKVAYCLSAYCLMAWYCALKALAAVEWRLGLAMIVVSCSYVAVPFAGQAQPFLASLSCLRPGGWACLWVNLYVYGYFNACIV